MGLQPKHAVVYTIKLGVFLFSSRKAGYFWGALFDFCRYLGYLFPYPYDHDDRDGLSHTPKFFSKEKIRKQNYVLNKKWSPQ